MRAVSILSLGLLAACVSDTLPPLGETILYIDTDAAVPQLISALRIEVISATDHTVIGTRNVISHDSQDWPFSFSVFDPSDTNVRNVLVRLRAFPAGRLDGNGDPQVGVTIDRLVLVHLVPGVVTRARVTLRGECFGTPIDLDTATSCSDTTRVLQPATLVSAGDPRAPSLAGTFGAAPCTAKPRGPANAADGTPLFQDEACLPGGAFLFGNGTEFGLGEASGLPERAVVVSPMRIDRYEVTVGRLRDAFAHGFVFNSGPGTAYPNDGPLTANGLSACTFSSSPRGREKYPVNCTLQLAARAFCQWTGGDLPTEAQWEYAAQVAGREFKTTYPWGEDGPTCSRTVYARGLPPINSCIGPGVTAGPAPEDASPRDLSLGFGLVDLGGNLEELVLDAHQSLLAPCWTNAALHDPLCAGDSLPRSVRGGAWSNITDSVASGSRVGSVSAPDQLLISPTLGFRCVRPGTE